MGTLSAKNMMLRPQTKKEQKIIKGVNDRYPDVSHNDKLKEYDAHLFAARFTKQIAEMADIMIVDATPVKVLRDRIGSTFAVLTETLAQLEDSSNLTDKQTKEHMKVALGAAAQLEDLKKQSYGISDYLNKQGGERNKGQFHEVNQLIDQIPNFNGSQDINEIRDISNKYGGHNFEGGIYTEENFAAQAAVNKETQRQARLQRELNENIEEEIDVRDERLDSLDDNEIPDFDSDSEPPRVAVRPRLSRAEARARVTEQAVSIHQMRENLGSENIQRIRDVQIAEELPAQSEDNLSEFFNGLTEMDNAAGSVFKSISDVWGLIRNMPTAGGLTALTGVFVGLIASSIDTVIAFQQLELTINGLSLGDAEKSLNTVKKISTEFGLDLEKTASNLAGFSAANQGTTLASQANEIFASVAGYGQAIGAGEDQMARAFKALEQMAAKGKVSLEELNGQLAEALSGASNIAADSLGMTRREMMEMAEAGNLLATDVIPKMAGAMKKLGKESKLTSKQTLEQEWNKLKSKLTLAKIEGLEVLNVFSNLSEVFTWFNDVLEKQPRILEVVTVGIVGLASAIFVLSAKMALASKAASALSVSFKAALASALPMTLGISALATAFAAISLVVKDDPLGRFFDGMGEKNKKVLENSKALNRETEKAYCTPKREGRNRRKGR